MRNNELPIISALRSFQFMQYPLHSLKIESVKVELKTILNRQKELEYLNDMVYHTDK